MSLIITAEIIDALNFDPPFSYHRPLRNNKSVLIGNQATEFKILFEEVYQLSLINPIMTAIIGSPGTGKTHFLWNLQDRTIKGEREGITLVYELKDKKPTTSDILAFIHKSDSFRNLAKKHNVFLSVTKEIDDLHIAKEINQLCEKINARNNNQFGICLGIDVIDEYVRKQAKKESVITVVRDLLGAFRLVLDYIDKICVIFALTKDVYSEITPAIHSDQTLRRRFVIPNSLNGEPVEFGQLEENEAYSLVSTFMGHWAKRNNINIQNFVSKNSTWPFDKSAIKLAWRAAPTPGTLSFVCIGSIIEKCTHVNSKDELKISELDVARYLLQNKNYSNFMNDRKVWEDIEFLVHKPDIENKISEFRQTALNKTGGYFSNSLLRNAFEKYYEVLGFKTKDEGYSDIIIGKEFERDSKQIGIKFVEGVDINETDIQAFSQDIQDSKIDAGLLICLTEKKDVNVNYGANVEISVVKINSKNYVPTLDSKIITIDDILAIIEFKDLEPDDRAKYVNYLDRKLNFRIILESLEFVMPATNEGIRHV